MINLIYLMLAGCASHIHNSDLLGVELGMTYNEVVKTIGKPHRTMGASNEYYMGTQTMYNHEVFIYRAHNDWFDTSGGSSDCYFIYADKVLRQFNCY